VKDYMYYRGDKYGDHKVDYKLGAVSRVSIVHYDAFVAKEDRVDMTPTKCFEFCRTVPNMGFFGLTNGRSCYCTPYYTAMESSKEQCEAPCEGEKTVMCGGKTKSSIFAMHMCGSTGEDLAIRQDTARELSAEMKQKVTFAKDSVAEMQSIAADIMPSFSKVGDSGASNLAQKAKDSSSREVEHSAADVEKLYRNLDKSADAARDVASLDLTQSDVMIEAEQIMDEVDAAVIEAEAAVRKLDHIVSYVSPPKPFFKTSSALRNYMPVMYFIDNKFDGIDDPKTKGKVGVPTTCTGDLVGWPIVGKNAEECAQVCDDNLVHGCVGFQHFDNANYKQKKAGQLCFLFSKFKTGFYYTGCKSDAGGEQQEQTGCWAKFSKFAGGKFEGSGTLKPGGFSGKPFCKECFKEFTHADRCYK